MISSKAISPLIAAVIIVAFVVSVAGISSTFFSGFTKRQAAGVETKSERIIDCSLAWIDIDEDMVNIGTNISIAVENNGRIDLSGLKIVAYDATGSHTYDATPGSINSGEVLLLEANHTGVAVNKIQVLTDCPGVDSTVEKVGGEWILRG